MKTKSVIFQSILASTALLLSGQALGALSMVDCGDTPGAVANTVDPLECAIGTLANDSPATEAGAINTLFQGSGDALLFVGKYDQEAGVDGAVPGYTLTAGPSTETAWDYFFSLASTYSGVVDFALMVKQPEGGQGGMTNVAYYWSGLELDIEGFYNSFNSDYSHISAFVRGADVPVSEPAPLALLGLGLLGVALLRRRA